MEYNANNFVTYPTKHHDNIYLDIYKNVTNISKNVITNKIYSTKWFFFYFVEATQIIEVEN